MDTAHESINLFSEDGRRQNDLTLSVKKVSNTATIVFLQLGHLFLFWDSCMRTLGGQPSTLVKQREGIVKFRVNIDVQKAAK